MQALIGTLTEGKTVFLRANKSTIKGYLRALKRFILVEKNTLLGAIKMSTYK